MSLDAQGQKTKVLFRDAASNDGDVLALKDQLISGALELKAPSPDALRPWSEDERESLFQALLAYK